MQDFAPLKVAVVGSGIAGLSAAWLLAARHQVSLFESANRLGGHSHTVDVDLPGGPVPVDTGFIVYNEVTYPNLVALFRHLDITTAPSTMTFAVSLDDGQLEYNGTDLRGLFAQYRNMVRPRFWSMLRDLMRFYREAPTKLGHLGTQSLGAYLAADKYGRAFRDDHLLPMAAAIWSAPAKILLDYPAEAFIRFCHNHGLLQVKDRPMWRTVQGGSRVYVGRLVERLGTGVKAGRAVAHILRHAGGADVVDTAGTRERFDAVVIATHADQALRLLDDPSPQEAALLGAFRYSRNKAVLHGDAKMMPRRRQVWASWNYIGRRGGGDGQDAELCVTYWMNRLQPLATDHQLFVTLNPTRPPDPRVTYRDETYEHPIFDGTALAAQRQLWSLQGHRRTWFCGAHFGAGFHEDGLQSGLAVAEQLGGGRRPWTVPNESGRIVMSVPALAAHGPLAA